MEIVKEIQEAIAKHLPSEVGGVLKTRLEQAEKDAIELVTTRQKVLDLTQMYKTEQKTVLNLQEELKKHTDLYEREKAVAIRERDIELTICKAQLANAQASKTDLMNLVSTVFRNPVVTETVCGSMTRSDQFGCQRSEPFNETRTRSST